MSTPKRKARGPTSHDVAKLAGVTQPTVSLVMSGRADQVGISKATQERILAVARDLSYVPNRLMRSIQSGRSGILGVYGPNQRWSIRHSYWSEALASLHEAAAEEQHELLFFTDSRRSPEAILERMLGGIVDGMIVQWDSADPVIERLAKSHMPVVAIGDPYPGIPSVAVENYESVKQIVRHLYERGHRTYVYLKVRDAELTKDFPDIADERRPKAYFDCLEELGVDRSHVHEVYGQGSITSALQKILQLRPAPTVAVCHNDEWAYRLMVVAEEAGIRVPEDLAITGFDGIPPPFVRKMVTTMRSPISEFCTLAVKNLIALTESKEAPPLVELPAKFLLGQTT